MRLGWSGRYRGIIANEEERVDARGCRPYGSKLLLLPKSCQIVALHIVKCAFWLMRRHSVELVSNSFVLLVSRTVRGLIVKAGRKSNEKLKTLALI